MAALALVLAGCSSGPVPRPRASTSSTTAAPTTTTANGLAAPYDWVRDSSAGLDVGGGPTATLASVLAPPAAPATGGGWQIAGTRTNTDGSTTATVWASSDAVNWTATPLTASGVNSVARAATLWGGRTVIVGSTGTGGAERAAAWLSPAPGAPFGQVEASAFAPTAPSSPPTGGPASTNVGGAEMDVVAAGALGLFVAGTVSGTQAVWYSTDGHHWTRLKDAESVIDGSTDPTINALLVSSNGVFAAGSAADKTNTNETDAAVWSSTDGIHWQQVQTAQTAFTGDGDHVINGLVNLGTAFVAVGGVRSGPSWSPASWISPDGSSWSEASQSFPMAGGPRPDDAGTTVAGVASTTTEPATTATGQLAAVGGSPAQQRLWTSQNGTGWTEVPLPANAAHAADWRAGKVATTGTTTVVIDNSSGSPRVLVDRPQGWDEISANPALFGTPAPTAVPVRLLTRGRTLVLVVDVTDPGQVLGTESTTATVLTSTDGTTWTPATTGSVFTGHDVSDATSLADGVVAVGSSSPLTATLAGGPTGASAWFSPDGRSWSADTEGQPTFGGGSSGPARADAVTRLGQTVVAVGQGAAGSAPPSAPAPTSGSATTAATAPPTPPPSGSAGVADSDGPADQAIAWLSADGRTWSGPTALDTIPSLGTERPEGACAGPDSVVAVGTGVTSGPAKRALAWSSTNGQRWQAATVTPTPPIGAEEVMEDCITTGNGFIAFGATQGPGNTTDPAVWYSNNGTQWTRQTVSAFQGTGMGPIRDLAVGGTTWLAVSGGSALGTAAGGNLGLWRTTDAGSSWVRINTTGAPWVAHRSVSVDRVALRGQDAVVAGVVDGRLAVWFGTPAEGSPGGGSAGGGSTGSSTPPGPGSTSTSSTG